MSKVLPLVITRAAPEQRAAFDTGFKRGTLPQLERLGRLNVIVAIDKKMRPAFTALDKRTGENDWITRCIEDFRVQADGFRMSAEPSGALDEVIFVLRLGRNAREANVIAKFLDEPLFIAFEMIQHGLHRPQPTGRSHRNNRNN